LQIANDRGLAFPITQDLTRLSTLLRVAGCKMRKYLCNATERVGRSFTRLRSKPNTALLGAEKGIEFPPPGGNCLQGTEKPPTFQLLTLLSPDSSLVLAIDPVLIHNACCHGGCPSKSYSELSRRSFPMKWYHVVHAGATLVLAVTITVFVVLLLAGVIEMRRPSAESISGPSQPIQGAKGRLLVVRGLRPNWEYRIFEGRNVIGRADKLSVDIDLQPQEPEDRIWSSRQHAAITCQGETMTIEDLSSANGTYVNRNIVPPGTKQALKPGDIVQIGEVQVQ
jgi:FHA domain